MKTCGIYKIENIINNKIYIGQSKNIFSRISQHRYDLNNKIHGNKHLQKSWNKHGKENFIFNVICECFPEELDIKEKEYIIIFDSINNGYNIKAGGADLEESIEYGKRLARQTYEKKINSKGICKTCKEETKNGYIRYCLNHKNVCKKCGKRIEINKTICDECKIIYSKKNNTNPITGICSICGKEIIKNSNIQKYCKECAKIKDRKQHKEMMQKRRAVRK